MKKDRMLVLVEDFQIGGFSAFYEEMPYAIAQGDTKEEAKKNLDDLILYIETHEDLSSL